MEYFTLNKDDLGAFLVACRQRGEVQVPTLADAPGHYRFAPLAEVGEAGVALDYHRTLLPPKKYFFPPEEVLYRYDDTGYHPEPLKLRPLILFGLHPCDIHGLAFTDRFFTRDHPDRTYHARRAGCLIIGLGCLPDEHCFCASTGTPHVDRHYDLFLWDLGARFFVLVRSEAGHDLVHLARGLFHDATAGDRNAYLSLLDRRRHAFTLSMETADLPQVLESQTCNAVWEALAAACFACGACSMVCPTCTCYDILDRPALAGGGVRCRRWTSCLFQDFDRVAGGGHFRPTKGARVANRYFHKEHGTVNSFGVSACVGCGRCIAACPAGIHVVNVFRQVRQSCGMAEE